MPNNKIVIVFVHGWSVTNTNTYGGLPSRLREEAKAVGIDIDVKEIFLGKYISFHNEVRICDISRAFRSAVEDQLSGVLKDGARFVCITHSTGGPVIRDWWHRYHETVPRSGICPMSHLIMLAPANYGSALAQLGKGRLSRIKSWFGGVEPGQGVLDWLELGSEEAWRLNCDWIRSDGSQINAKGVFPFVLTGQYIDRKLYDHLNTYTGELGSDGVVRVAAANNNGRYIKLVQEKPKKIAGKKGKYKADKLIGNEFVEAPTTALRIISGKSHSGIEMGIMRSVKEKSSDRSSAEIISAIISCIKVRTKTQYNKLCEDFAMETEAVQKKELVENEKRLLKSDRHFIHDTYSMVIFRVMDDKNHPVSDFDLILTAKTTDDPARSKGDPNHLPSGFFMDRQRNKRTPETITYYINYAVMVGADAIINNDEEVIRKPLSGVDMLGFKIKPRPVDGFVHYLPCEIEATRDLLTRVLRPNSTTLVDICLRRVVRKNVFRVDKMTSKKTPKNFKGTKPGDHIAE